jgi:hypothetical protein
VAGGLHAESLVCTPGVSHLYLVDPYALDSDDTEGADHWGVNAPPLAQLEIEARERLAKYPRQVTFVKLTSVAASSSPSIPAEVDFVYIDSNHNYRAVTENIRAWWPKIRPGGVLGGHDFYNGYARSHDGVVKAVTEFAVLNRLALQVELPDWWVQKS